MKLTLSIVVGLRPAFFRSLALVALCSLPAVAAWAGQPEPREAVVAAAKKLFADQQEAVVGVSAVVKIRYSAEGLKDAPSIPEREQKMESIGTIIDPSGLLVTALSTLDPSKEISSREYRMGGGIVRLEATADVQEVRVIMADGTEIPAEVVMKDADLDLCFIQIKMQSKEAKGVALRCLDLRRGQDHAAVSDDVINLARMDEVLNRQASVTRGQVLALTRKPREFIRVSGATLGGPTFTPDGRVVGIAVNRAYRGRSSLLVLIPAADVLEVAEQAKQAQAAAASSKKKTGGAGNKTGSGG